MRRPPETNAKRHHHVPVSYILRFSPDGKHLFVFDRVSNTIRRDIPHNVAVESEFNTVVAHGVKKERWAEAKLAEIDSIARPLLDKIERGESLSREERWYVSFFIAFGDTRGGGFRHELHASGDHEDLEAGLRSADLSQIVPDGEERHRFEEAFAAASGVWVDARTIARMALDDMARIASGGANVVAMVWTGSELAQLIFHAGWVIVKAPPDSSFITSDRPLGLWRPDHGLASDPFEPGVLKLFPVSPATALIIGNLAREPFTTEQTIDPPVVRLANAAILRRSHRFAVAPSEPLLQIAEADAARLFQVNSSASQLLRGPDASRARVTR